MATCRSQGLCQKEGGASKDAAQIQTVGFLYTVLRLRRPSQPSPTSAVPSKVSEAGSETGCINPSKLKVAAPAELTVMSKLTADGVVEMFPPAAPERAKGLVLEARCPAPKSVGQINSAVQTNRGSSITEFAREVGQPLRRPRRREQACL